MSEPTRILLPETAIPTHWYNIVVDMPNPPAPPLAPNGQPVTPEQMGAIFPEPLYCIPLATTSCPPAFTPADSAITATRRLSRSSTTRGNRRCV